MRNKLLLIFSVFLLPLVLGWGAARAADQQDAGGFKIALSDGSLVNGAVSFVINLDTQYGQIKIPSSSLVSARFDLEQGWADIQLSDAQLKLRYKPASSDLKATTAVGPLTLALVNVARISKGSVEFPGATSPNAAASQNTAVSQAGVSPPSAASVPQSPPVTVSPPTVVYQYPYQYQYASPAPYYYDYYAPYYWPGPYIGWPYFGIGFGWWGGGYGGFHGGFGHRR